jgi:hypothetical protein
LGVGGAVCEWVGRVQYVGGRALHVQAATPTPFETPASTTEACVCWMEGEGREVSVLCVLPVSCLLLPLSLVCSSSFNTALNVYKTASTVAGLVLRGSNDNCSPALVTSCVTVTGVLKNQKLAIQVRRLGSQARIVPAADAQPLLLSPPPPPPSLPGWRCEWGHWLRGIVRHPGVRPQKLGQVLGRVPCCIPLVLFLVVCACSEMKS